MEVPYKTCVEMLRQRKYKIVDQEDHTRIVATKPDGKTMVVFFTEMPKFNVKSAQIYIALMSDLKIYHAIIVYKKGVTSFTRKAIMKSEDLKFELIAEADLRYNITKHRLQPVFEQLSSDEAEIFKKEFGVKFGVMKIDDPIARFYAYTNGDVIRVTRKTGKNKFVTYRLVRN
jgi:DNA-directed RNA polymerase subunit H (RpoH/RPB5)